MSEFQALVGRLLDRVPPEYLDGVVAVDVSAATVPHPVRGDVYTLGECIPLEWSGSGADLQSRIVLYHGSFRALARLGELDWEAEAWETLSHELRHHLEWRANLAELEAFDWAAEQNFARHEGEPFDPVFYRNGVSITDGVYKVDDDVFIEAPADIRRGTVATFTWHGRRYRLPTPASSQRTFVFLTVEGLEEPPPGDAVLVLPGRPSLWSLFRAPTQPVQGAARASVADG